MKPLLMPNEFFQLLTELESNLALCEQQARLVTLQVEVRIPDHTEKESLGVHAYYLGESTATLQRIRGRFSNMRHFFLPAVGQSSQ